MGIGTPISQSRIERIYASFINQAVPCSGCRTTPAFQFRWRREANIGPRADLELRQAHRVNSCIHAISRNTPGASVYA